MDNLSDLFSEKNLDFCGTLHVKIYAAQDELPSASLENSSTNSRRVIYVPRFLIRFNHSTYTCPAADINNRLEVRSMTRKIRIPCSALTGPTCAAEAEKILSSKLSEWQIRVPVGDFAFLKKHYGECYSGCPNKNADWVEEFQDFLRCVRRKSYNLGHNVIPVSLNVDALLPMSDIGYSKFVSSLTRERQRLPNFWAFWRAGVTSTLCNAAAVKGDCPICLEPLHRANHPVVSLSCFHCFHLSCIGQWLSANPSCPVCRFKFED